MKKVLLSLAAVTAIATAASPAAAARDDRFDMRERVSINERQQDIARRIDRSFERHQITRAEANRLMAQLHRIDALERHYRRGGLSGWERQELMRRLDAVQAQLRIDRKDRDYGYGYGYGRW